MFAAMFAVALCAISCETDGDILDEYAPPGLSEAVSEFAPSITEILPGYERLRISWKLNNDESTGAEVEKCYLFNGTDIVEIDLSDLTPEEGVYTTIVEDMPEGSYNFYMKHLDSDNNLSGAGASVSAFIYGDDYAASLTTHRKVLRSTSTSEGGSLTHTLEMSSTWDSSISEVNVYYVNSLNEATATTAGYVLAAPTEGSSYGEEEYPDYVTCLTYDPSATIYTLPNATVNKTASSSIAGTTADYMNIIIETVVTPFDGNALDEIKLSAYKTLSEETTFVEVSSLEALRLYTTKTSRHLNVKMTPGVYSFTMDDALNGNFSTAEVGYGELCPVIICLEGESCTYDLTGVTIEVGDDVGDSCAGVDNNEFCALQTLGNYNVLRGLTIRDLYEEQTTPSDGYTNIKLDGEWNVLEDVTVYSKGSSPYGYGDIFGKGTDNTIGHSKHCSTLQRGNWNTIRRCSLIHRAYGHTHFFQGTQGAFVEDCYFEGDVFASDDIYNEAGTGSAADLVDFQSSWGYKLPTGYVMATGEDSVRTYGSGTTYVSGYRYSGDEISDDDDDDRL